MPYPAAICALRCRALDAATDPLFDDLRAAMSKPTSSGALAASLARLRERDPVHWIAPLGVWFVTRHDDVRRLFADPRLTADPRAFERYQDEGDGVLSRWLSDNPFLTATPGEAGRGRKLVSAALTPRAVARMESQIREVVEQFAAPLRGRRDVVDLLAEYTAAIPGTVVSRITGVPPKGADEARFRELARKTVRGVNPILSDAKRERTARAAAEMFDYVRALARERLDEPREDLISDLLGVSGHRSPETVDLVGRVVAGLVSTGTEATVLASTRALWTLLAHPDQLERLRSERSLLPTAVEELLRYDSGLAEMPRYALEDFELRSRVIRKGQLVVLSVLSANRDPDVFPSPDRLDLRRSSKDLLAFGYGAHYCIGAPLARSELRWMIDAALDFLPPGARVLEDRVRSNTKMLWSRVKSLPVAFGAASAASARSAARPTALVAGSGIG